MVPGIVFNDVSRAAMAIADWDLDERVGFKCCGAPKRKNMVDFVTKDANLEKTLVVLFNEREAHIDCCTEMRLVNLFRTQEICCELPDFNWMWCLVPCCCCLALCVETPTQVSKLERVKALIAAAKAMDREITNTADPFVSINPTTCLCFGGNLLVPKFFMKMSAKFSLYAEAERLLKESIELEPLSVNPDDVKSTNAFYKEAVLKPRRAYDRISKFLLNKTIGGDDFNYLSKTEEGNRPFDAECTLTSLFGPEEMALLSRFLTGKDKDGVNQYNLPENFESLPEFQPLCRKIDGAVLANYNNLGADRNVLPKHVRQVTSILIGGMDVLNYSCRLKEAKSIVATHTSGKLFDLFGVRYYVTTGSVFQTFSLCFLHAEAIYNLPIVHSVAVSHKLRGKGFFDFKIVVRFNVPGLPRVEIQVLPIQNFITDAVTGGAKDYKGIPNFEAPPEEVEENLKSAHTPDNTVYSPVIGEKMGDRV